MSTVDVPISIDVIRLLDRLDPRVGEPCAVAGCVHCAHDATPVPMAA